MYKRGLINELSKEYIQRAAKNTVAKYQKQADKSSKEAATSSKKQDSTSSKISRGYADSDSELASQKRSQARRVLAKAHGRDTGKNDYLGGKPDEYSGEAKRNVVGVKTKHGLSRADLKGRATKGNDITRATRRSRDAGKNAQNKPSSYGVERSSHPSDASHKSNRGTGRGRAGNSHTGEGQ